MNKEISETKRLYLDGIRGLAAFAVVVSHYIQVFYPAALNGKPQQAHFEWDVWYGHSPINLFFNGQFAVCLFFVLSGYVLSVKMVEEIDSETFLKMLQSSAIRRYIRLAVPAAVSVFLVYLALVMNAFHLHEIWETTWTDMKKDYYALDPNLYTVIKAAIFDPFFRFKAHAYNPVLWTMSYELAGSFLIFGFLALFGRVKKRWIVYAVLSLAFIQTYFVAFLWGMLLADLLKHRWVQSKILPVLALIMGIYLGSAPYTPLMGTMYEPIQVWTQHIHEWIQLNLDPRLLARTLGSFLILFALLRLKTLQHLFGWRMFAYLGKVSFSLYLIHFTFLTTFSAFLFSKWIHHFSYNVAYAMTFMASMAPLFVLSHYYMKYIDQGALKLARLVERKMAASSDKRKAKTDNSAFFG
ncbi:MULTISPECIES: acyltransferase [unclassified Paenibacillus]|uniref:acyltransferase family protein n=1 Tax=unclassified Paenibacillus TaxID=185978 RepID=UPI000956B854|nr:MULTISPECIES: acyltransferase [unclassified Paenibacillus]ASS66940.2 acyltransferase [Paenibacillus sp. RUD330]SIR51515.1 Peptidoglycan/LPS O-acetylase OafA/YrhL, contains acyltransferase and SGNH-hydrolase domains [Paenibacillus sp. RU4X]SIR60419.1 Peptidoglycan/LPS O-acetylase OafA/YrhL, contains acyltransferase and SGNH-hydrolase domains [Paenibacillus sp. RU4T]